MLLWLVETGLRMFSLSKMINSFLLLLTQERRILLLQASLLTSVFFTMQSLPKNKVTMFGLWLTALLLTMPLHHQLLLPDLPKKISTPLLGLAFLRCSWPQPERKIHKLPRNFCNFTKNSFQASKPREVKSKKTNNNKINSNRTNNNKINSNRTNNNKISNNKRLLHLLTNSLKNNSSKMLLLLMNNLLNQLKELLSMRLPNQQ